MAGCAGCGRQSLGIGHSSRERDDGVYEQEDPQASHRSLSSSFFRFL
jgi:hypothetical protein